MLDLFNVDPNELRAACGEDPSLVCRTALRITGSPTTAEWVDSMFRTPLRILIILLLAWFLYRLVNRAIERFVARISDGEEHPKKRFKRRLRGSKLGDRLPAKVVDTGPVSLRSAARAQTIGLVLRSVASVVIWTVALVTILGEIGINLGPIIASAGIVGIALGFGAQSLVKDFLSGIFMLIEDQYGVGDVVDVGEATGTIEAVTLRTTRMRDVNGVVWHVPNGNILRVGNFSQQWARALLDVSVAYDTDVELAQRVIKEVADRVWQDEDWAGQILEEPEVWGVEQFGPDALVIRLVVKTQPSQQWKVLRELRARLKAAFDDAGIEIPFPQRTVWVRRDQGTSVASDGGDGDSLDEIAGV